MSENRTYIKLVHTQALQLGSEDDCGAYFKFRITSEIREAFSTEDREYLRHWNLDIDSDSIWVYVPNDRRYCYLMDVDIEIDLIPGKPPTVCRKGIKDRSEEKEEKVPVRFTKGLTTDEKQAILNMRKLKESPPKESPPEVKESAPSEPKTVPKKKSWFSF